MAKKKAEVSPEESVYGHTGRPTDDNRKEQLAGLPERVLHGLCWSFRGGEYADRAAFDEEVKQYQIDITGEDTWFPDEIVIPSQKIRVVYMYWQDEKQLDGLVELTRDGGEGFTAGELLFKLHNAVVGPLREDNHCFFEGLSLHSHQAPEAAPLYVLHQGS
jgi:hypothetical protein